MYYHNGKEYNIGDVITTIDGVFGRGEVAWKTPTDHIESRGIPKKLPAIRKFDGGYIPQDGDEVEVKNQRFEQYNNKQQQGIIAQISKRLFGLTDGSEMSRAYKATRDQVQGRVVKATILVRRYAAVSDSPWYNPAKVVRTVIDAEIEA